MIQIASTQHPRQATEEPPFRVEVSPANGSHRLTALRPMPAGTVILAVSGVFVDRPSKYSIQVDDNLHIEASSGQLSPPDQGCHPWRFLNHSCDPNAILVGLQLIAIKPVRPGDEITFDYNTTEYEMATPFTCRCGSCGASVIRGFRFLPPDRQRALYPRLAGHLRRGISMHGPA